MAHPDDPAVRPDAVVTHLRDTILSLELPPGSVVTEALVARTHDVARPTARIAIDRLVAEGLLVREPHHAARVRRLDRDDLHDLFFARAAIECAAVELLAADAVVPDEALARNLAMRALQADAAFTLDDIGFHSALVHGSNSPRLRRMHGLLMGEIELGIAQIEAHRLRSLDEVNAEHQQILDAIHAGDDVTAVTLTRAHIFASRDHLVTHHDTREESESA